jgi:hypothetical protein
MTCLVRNWSVVPAHCSRPARDRHAWSDHGGSRFRFQNPVATGSGVTLLVEAGHLIMESRPVLPPRAYRTSTCRRSGRQRSEDTRTRSAEAEHSEALNPTWHNSDNSLSHDTTPSTPSGTCPTGMSPWRVLRARLIGTSHRRRGGVRWPVGSGLPCFPGARLGV